MIADYALYAIVTALVVWWVIIDWREAERNNP
jgi:hypothetical protein